MFAAICVLKVSIVQCAREDGSKEKEKIGHGGDRAVSNPRLLHFFLSINY